MIIANSSFQIPLREFDECHFRIALPFLDAYVQNQGLQEALRILSKAVFCFLLFRFAEREVAKGQTLLGESKGTGIWL